ncbi:hypothetical protein AAFF_G00429580 [Aldrovandia affinis]|uniref:Uncharacterized protein n=1 Tax=Aldrovandia affinis TaxID=143900 RepID=A0AAD7R306_9TELE|nr:hypothetical protein AAFF_G00429580 [Aldrovandia affinis]
MTKAPDLGVGPGSAPPPVSALASGQAPHSAAPHGQQAFGRGRVFGLPPAPGPGSPPVPVPAEESGVGGGEASCVGAGAALSEGGCPPPTAQDPETPQEWGDSKDPGGSGDGWKTAKQQRKRPLSGDSPGARDPKGPRNPPPTSSLDGFTTDNPFSPISDGEEFSTEMDFGMDLNLASPALPLDCSENKALQMDLSLGGEGGVEVRDGDTTAPVHISGIVVGGGEEPLATFCRVCAVVARRRRDRAGWPGGWHLWLICMDVSNRGEPVDWAVYEGAKERLRGLLEARAKALAFQAQLRELEEGERPTAYFFQAAKARRGASAIAGLRRVDGTLAEGPAMLAVAESYYAELFSRQACDPAAEARLLDCVSARLGSGAQAMEADVTLEEVRRAVFSIRAVAPQGMTGSLGSFTPPSGTSWGLISWRSAGPS